MESVTFFFGAGAEYDYGMPLGMEYTLDSMLRKRKKLYESLKVFYKNVKPNYIKEYMFKKNSRPLRKMILRGLKEKIDEEKMQEIYEALVDDRDASEKIKENGELFQKFFYYGLIEKDFFCIIDPASEATKFWRLINYFWSAYFSILLPTLKLSDRYCERAEKQDWAYILENLEEIVEYIYGEDFLGEVTSKCNGYYKTLQSAFKTSNALTTNYTPFLKKYWKEGNAVYLAGELSNFELSEELRIIDITEDKCDSIRDVLVFPYLLTQAPVKPIISWEQLDQYRKAMRILEQTECLVIVGYNINGSDNHINALIRHFLMDPSKKLIFCMYKNAVSAEITEDEIRHEKQDVCRKLKIKESDQVMVLHNSGCAYALTNDIKMKLKDW